MAFSIKCITYYANFLFLTVLLWLLAVAAPAGDADRESRRIFSVAMADLSGELTDALNHLQNELGKPPVAEVNYDGEKDCFYWTGPKTGKAMSMDRARFLHEIYAPYELWLEAHPDH
jgi:hypothetical protein